MALAKSQVRKNVEDFVLIYFMTENIGHPQNSHKRASLYRASAFFYCDEPSDRTPSKLHLVPDCSISPQSGI